jgi:hypothetical protein
MQIRVSVHTGEVVVQAIENSIYQTYDAAVNRCIYGSENLSPTSQKDFCNNICQ